MITEHILWKHPQGFIVTSDKEADEKDLNKDEVYLNLEDFTLRKALTGNCWAIKGKRKIIAQQSQIIFSSLKEEEQKEIGIYYKPVVEAVNRAWSYLNALGYFTTPTNEGRIVENLLIQAKVRSQELLSDRRFTLEDVQLAFAKGADYTTKPYPQNVQFENEYKQSLSQQSWKVECVEENGKIKILKLL